MNRTASTSPMTVVGPANNSRDRVSTRYSPARQGVLPSVPKSRPAPRRGCRQRSVADLRPPRAAPRRQLSLALRVSIRPADVWSKGSDGPAQEPPPRAGVLHAPSGPGGQAESCSCSPAALGWGFLSLSGVSKDFDGPAYELDATRETTRSRHRIPTTPPRRSYTEGLQDENRIVLSLVSMSSHRVKRTYRRHLLL
jgi:hypothetical protein